MALFFDGEELAFGDEKVSISKLPDRLAVRTKDGTFTAAAVRDGDSILVSFRGNQFKLETKKPRTSRSDGVGSGEYRSPMPGLIVDVLVSVGDKVLKGQKLMVLEAMKTQQPFLSPFDGVIKTVNATKGAQVKDGELLIVVEAEIKS